MLKISTGAVFVYDLSECSSARECGDLCDRVGGTCGAVGGLVPPQGQRMEGGNFGESLLISPDGERVFVGHPGASLVHVFEKQNVMWVHRYSISPPESSQASRFGHSLAAAWTSSDGRVRIVIGTQSGNSQMDRYVKMPEAAFVHTYDSNSEPELDAEAEAEALELDSGKMPDELPKHLVKLGEDVAISADGERMVVSDPDASHLGVHDGVVFWFEWGTQEEWSHTQTLEPQRELLEANRPDGREGRAGSELAGARPELIVEREDGVWMYEEGSARSAGAEFVVLPGGGGGEVRVLMGAPFGDTMRFGEGVSAVMEGVGQVRTVQLLLGSEARFLYRD